MLQLRLHLEIIILNVEIMTMETAIMGNITNYLLLIPDSPHPECKEKLEFRKLIKKYLIANNFH